MHIIAGPCPGLSPLGLRKCVSPLPRCPPCLPVGSCLSPPIGCGTEQCTQLCGHLCTLEGRGGEGGGCRKGKQEERRRRRGRRGKGRREEREEEEGERSAITACLSSLPCLSHTVCKSTEVCGITAPRNLVVDTLPLLSKPLQRFTPPYRQHFKKQTSSTTTTTTSCCPAQCTNEKNMLSAAS